MKIDVYEVQPLDEFKRRVGHLAKKKHFHSLPSQIQELYVAFKSGEFSGDCIRRVEKPDAMKFINYDCQIQIQKSANRMAIG